MKRSFFPIIIILSMLLSITGSIYPVQAGFSFTPLDLDQDGISNVMETSGWYNWNYQTGAPAGPFITNPNQADSDHDGLTDGEEKLFNTNPNDPTSPGIAVKYENSYKTFEYYSTTDTKYLSMVQGGNRYLLTEGLVIRRGSTFRISAINSSTASLTISGDGLTPITPVRDPARGGWLASIPINGTVGTYTATITDGAWSKTLPIYVIFELPTDMTQAQIGAFVYDDDPANQRDEVAVWWRVKDYKYYYYNNQVTETPPGPTDCVETSPGVCSNELYHQDFGYAQAFWTEQFTKKVLLNFALPAIQGQTKPFNAASLIAHKADASLRVNYSGQKNSFSSATYIYVDPVKGYGMAGGACETNAGVFTSMLRSVGIASRPFNLDYNKSPFTHGEDGNGSDYEYDHAVMMWVKGTADAANRWYAGRTSVQSEAEYQTTPAWVGGINDLRPLDQVGIYDPAHPANQFAKFQDKYSDLIQTVNEGWDWQNGSLGGGMVNTVWTAQGVPDVEYNNTGNPADPFLNRDYKWDSLHPLKMIYQSPYVDILNCQLWQGDTFAPSEWYDPGDPTANPPIPADPRYNSDPLGRTASGTYRLFEFPDPILPDVNNPLENWPYNPKPFECSPSSRNTAACTTAFKNGSLTCSPLPGQTFANAPAAPQPAAPIPAPETNTKVTFDKIISDSAVDENGDGRFDALVITAELTSFVSGEYQLGGWLHVGENEIRAVSGQVSLTPGTQIVQVTFEGQLLGESQVDGPYQVDALWAAPADKAISDLALPEEMAAYKTYSYASSAYKASAFTVRAATIDQNFSYSVTQKNASGLIKSIAISVPLNIAIPGTFSVEGDLYDGKGAFVGHATWTGDGPIAALEYQVSNTQPPYSLQHLNLVDNSGKPLDARYAPVYQIDGLSGKVSLGNAAFTKKPANLFSIQTIDPPSTFTVTPVDLNGNGRIDQLKVSAAVNITVGGTYWMEGLLVDDRGVPAAWSVGKSQTMNAGLNQTLQMTFDGKQLFDQLPLSTSHPFTLAAVKIFSGSPAQAVLEADLPVTNFNTPAYQRSGLEPSGMPAVFEDDLETGEAKWGKSGAWSLTTTTWNSGYHAYVTTGSGILTMAAPLDFAYFKSFGMRYRYASDLGIGDSAKLQISTNGTTWITLKTYTGLTNYWTTEEWIDLNAYKGEHSVYLRFNVTKTSGAMLWSVDDVTVVIGPFTTFVPAIAR